MFRNRLRIKYLLLCTLRYAIHGNVYTFITKMKNAGRSLRAIASAMQWGNGRTNAAVAEERRPMGGEMPPVGRTHAAWLKAFQCIGHSWAIIDDIWASPKIWYAGQSFASGHLWINLNFSYLHTLAESSALLISISRSLQTVGSYIIKELDELKGVADSFAIMRQNSEESFGKIMDAAVKMAEDMNIAVYKYRIAKRSL